MDSRPQILSVEEAAALLGVQPRTVAEWAKTEEIPGRKVGRRWLFFEDELIAHLRALPPGGRR